MLAATLTKAIRELMPKDVRVSKDVHDKLMDCCLGESAYQSQNAGPDNNSNTQILKYSNTQILKYSNTQIQ